MCFYWGCATFARAVIHDALYVPAPLSGKTTHFSEGIEARSSFGTDLSAVFWTPKNNVLHFGGGRSGHHLLWCPIKEMEFHKGPIIEFSWCRNTQCKSGGCLEGPRGSQMAPPGLASRKTSSSQNQMKTEVLGCISAKQPWLRGKAANSVRVPVCKLAQC